jgi:hypothetical protein
MTAHLRDYRSDAVGTIGAGGTGEPGGLQQRTNDPHQDRSR